MPNKRRPISFPELEPKGKAAILRSAAEVAAETQQLDDQEAGMPENMLASTAEQEDVENRARYPKATYRLSPETLEAIDDAKRTLRRQYNIKVSLEEIAEQAIQAVCLDLQESQDASLLVAMFSGRRKLGK